MNHLGAWYRWIALGILAIVLTASGIVGTRWLVSATDKGSGIEDLSVEAQWNRTISRLGIEPVYPPQEDFAVGDVFAVVVNTQTDSRSTEPVSDSKAFIGRAIKLDHIPVHSQLKEAYSNMPVFPAFGQALAVSGTNPVSNQLSEGKSEGGLFGIQSRALLPQAAFPGISITFTGSATASAKSGIFGLSLGASRQAEQTVELQSVETYGLPSITATQLLEGFCSDTHAQATASCSEATARRHLANIFDQVLERSVNPNTGKLEYRYAVKIIMISRVYYARQIIERSGSGTAQGGDTVAQRPNDGNTTANTSPTINTTQTIAGSDTGDTLAVAALKARMAEMSQRLTMIEQGGLVSYRLENNHWTYLHQNFTRPIAFGYRSVGYNFTPSPVQTK